MASGSNSPAIHSSSPPRSSRLALCSQAGLDRDGRWVLDYHRAARCDQFLAAATYTSRLPDRSLDIINEGGFR